MIRVARPDSLLLLADEAEEQVRNMYEKQPGSYVQDRQEAVAAPVDLGSQQIQEVHLEPLRNGIFYALSHRT
jgi:hypothetical protein